MRDGGRKTENGGSSDGGPRTGDGREDRGQETGFSISPFDNMQNVYPMGQKTPPGGIMLAPGFIGKCQFYERHHYSRQAVNKRQVGQGRMGHLGRVEEPITVGFLHAAGKRTDDRGRRTGEGGCRASTSWQG